MARRGTYWVDSRLSRTVANGGQDQVSLMGSGDLADFRGATLIRTIVRLNICSTTVAGAFGVQRASQGIGVASREAQVGGVVPDPDTADDAPARGWIWRNSRMIAQNGIGAVVVFDAYADIRAARKVDNGAVFLITENFAVTGTTFNLHVEGLIRLLFKAP